MGTFELYLGIGNSAIFAHECRLVERSDNLRYTRGIFYESKQCVDSIFVVGDFRAIVRRKDNTARTLAAIREEFVDAVDTLLGFGTRDRDALAGRPDERRCQST